jgi:DNA-binding FadR family transcriptional regulator
VRKHLSDLDEIFDFRVAVEQQAAYLAAQRRTDEDLKVMRRAIEAHPAGDAPLDTFRSADGQFHTALARAARNPRLEEASRKVRSDLFIPVDTIEFEQEIQLTRTHHTLIFEAIKKRDAGGALSQMVTHIEETRKVINKQIVTAK